MARTVDTEKLASKRKEILDAVQRLVFTRGYEQMSIQDVLNEVQISNGAFHHYFNSRGALLEALIERMGQEAEKPFLSIFQNPELSGIEKLQGFFDALDRLRMDIKTELVMLLRVWYNDDNALVRLKVDEVIFKQRAPLIAEIVRQGIREGSFSTNYPDKAGEVIMGLLQSMGNTHARLLLQVAERNGETDGLEEIISDIVTTHASYMEAVERVLGAPPNSLYRADAAGVKVWVEALRGDSGR